MDNRCCWRYTLSGQPVDNDRAARALLMGMSLNLVRWSPNMDIETLAKHLHEAGREAVMQNKVVSISQAPTFREWEQITEDAREGRRIQAKYLLARFSIEEHESTDR